MQWISYIHLPGIAIRIPIVIGPGQRTNVLPFAR
jgi:hypothetical protein